MMHNQFFILVKRLDGPAVTEFRLGNSPNLGEAPSCPVCNFCLGPRVWLPPYRVQIESWGSEYGDIVFGAGSGDILVTQKMRDVMATHGLIGLSGYEPIEIENTIAHNSKNTAKPPQYFRGVIQRSKAAIDVIASGVQWSDPIVCDFCLLGNELRRRSKIIIDNNTWTGEDIFYARGIPGKIVVSSRFKNLCEQSKISNAILLPAEKRR